MQLVCLFATLVTAVSVHEVEILPSGRVSERELSHDELAASNAEESETRAEDLHGALLEQPGDKSAWKGRYEALTAKLKKFGKWIAGDECDVYMVWESVKECQGLEI